MPSALPSSTIWTPSFSLATAMSFALGAPALVTASLVDPFSATNVKAGLLRSSIFLTSASVLRLVSSPLPEVK